MKILAYQRALGGRVSRSLLGALVLWLSVFISGCAELKQPLEIEVTRASANLSMGSPQIVVEVEVTTPIRVAFLGLEGELLVDGRAMPFEVRGLDAGAPLLANTPTRVEVVVRPSLADIGISAARLLTEQKSTLVFDGHVSVEAMGQKFKRPAEYTVDVAW